MVIGVLFAAAGAFIATQNRASKIAVPMIIFGFTLVILDLWCR